MHVTTFLTSALYITADASRAVRALPVQEYQHFLGPISEPLVSGDRQPSSPFRTFGSSHQKSDKKAGFVALGDSYSAGIGTGVNGTEDACRHGLHGHPRLIADDLSASHGGPDTVDFQFLSCTGSETQDVMVGAPDSQIDVLNTSMATDFALLSLGGNDLGFFDVINSCIFRFYSFYSGTCEQALNNTLASVVDDGFERRFRVVVSEILDKIRWEKNPDFFITVTGYAKFFNEETDECDDMSLGVWWGGPKLTKDIRIKMNELVDAVNEKIQRAVDMINSHFVKDKLLFVNFDQEFEGHRFCERGITEPDYLRNETWFFLVGGLDNAQDDLPSTTLPGPAEILSQENSRLVDPSSCLEPAQRSGDWGELALCYMSRAKYLDPSLQLARNPIVSLNSMWYVPTYYGKVFHPRSLGHETIRDKIYETWTSSQGLDPRLPNGRFR